MAPQESNLTKCEVCGAGTETSVSWVRHLYAKLSFKHDPTEKSRNERAQASPDGRPGNSQCGGYRKLAPNPNGMPKAQKLTNNRVQVTSKVSE